MVKIFQSSWEKFNYDKVPLSSWEGLLEQLSEFRLSKSLSQQLMGVFRAAEGISNIKKTSSAVEKVSQSSWENCNYLKVFVRSWERLPEPLRKFILTESLSQQLRGSSRVTDNISTFRKSFSAAERVFLAAEKMSTFRKTFSAVEKVSQNSWENFYYQKAFLSGWRCLSEQLRSCQLPESTSQGLRGSSGAAEKM